MDEKLIEIAKQIVKENPSGCLANNYKNISNDDYIDIEEILNEYIYEYNYGIGLCGCGNPEFTIKILYEILKIQDDYRSNRITWEEKEIKFYNLCNLSYSKNNNIVNYDGLIQFVFYILNDREFLEHGSSVGGSYLTEKGKNFLYVAEVYLKENKEEN